MQQLLPPLVRADVPRRLLRGLKHAFAARGFGLGVADPFENRVFDRAREGVEIIRRRRVCGQRAAQIGGDLSASTASSLLHVPSRLACRDRALDARFVDL
jgi:hypothetical protein